MSDDTGNAIAVAIVAAGAWIGGWIIPATVLTLLLLFETSPRQESQKRKPKDEQEMEKGKRT